MLRNEEKEAEATFEKYKDILYRIAFSNMKSKADAEDVVQEAFCRYLKTESRHLTEKTMRGHGLSAWLSIFAMISRKAHGFPGQLLLMKCRKGR